MPKAYPLLPSVDGALKMTRDYTFRGNTFGQAGAYHAVAAADRERASKFDVSEAIRQAEQQRHEAGLN
jgi:hypothetical protein